ncbi:DNA (cytosine-5-)-methyltransferase [Mycoplasmopsis anatis]|uniref:DNA (cytosine-5-)-methyltransferase n=1 Tax=Mycoplasmopsis anatis TaxID=171279 RepID=UPI001C4DEEC9|nr:DNA (cytosine-5-)-methyltransferase [Mycoplasmopsis anatis]MBW0594386.1 DNA (cytosine-5-)-methyltransferase [Mycoplasmopsis anatis]MBW0595337.1 DNA (cytosine-5-)-methyltransferase [Mycoplasmopsis anatis]MBW0597984.1 DNA (cytosine-5-)-methyltransferase [Mycoplasmopsis anatis]MBW0598758.1 DNA (cytosine-5-)-methyltransferase [Mycoplasmopsis anatis]MBW0600881.1 DNA (cytosine-5-)-methyltransferase [Mycoplasmopsis anatis]
MQKIKIFEAFAGIGAQHKSITNINNKNNKVLFEVVGTSDWDIYCNIVYAALHKGLTLDNVDEILNRFNVNSKEKMIDFFRKNVFSINSKTPLRSLPRDDLLKLLIASNKLSNNFSDIKALKGEDIKKLNVDLLTYSFPCQGLSIANMGRSKGILNSESTSHLVWEIDRIISEMTNKPRYLLLENVKALVKKYNHEYKEWIRRLEEHGYKTYTAILNAYEHNSLQTRERVYAISFLNDIKLPFSNDYEFNEYVKFISKEKAEIDRKQKFFDIFDIYNTKYSDEALECLISDTPSRRKIVDDNLDISDLEKLESRNFRINTLTTKQDRNPNVGTIKFVNNITNKLNNRFITPREAYKLMGFDDNDFNKLSKFIKLNILPKECLYRQAGNSIDINALEDIFNVILKIEENTYEK